jgi:hypothetical protein
VFSVGDRSIVGTHPSPFEPISWRAGSDAASISACGPFWVLNPYLGR